MRQIQRILGLSFSSVRYNVYNLKKSREVLDWSESGRSRLFPPEISEWEKIAYSFLRNHSSRKILRAFTQHTWLTNKQLSEITGYAKSTLSQSLHRLVDVEILIISFSPEGRVAYQLKDPERMMPLIRSADQTVLEEATDRFIQLWDF